MQITFFGVDSDGFPNEFLATYAWTLPFLNGSGSATEVTLVDGNGDPVIVVTGSGLTLSGGALSGGTITGFTGLQDGRTVGSVSNISWDVAVLSEDSSTMADLFSASGPIVIDAGTAIGGYDQTSDFFAVSDDLTQAFDFTGSDHGDSFRGSAGADSVNMGRNITGTDLIYGSLGDDTIDFAGAMPGDSYYLYYGAFSTSVTFRIDGAANTGSATTADFTDTLQNLAEVLASGSDSGGLSLEGGGLGTNRYIVDPGPGGWLHITDSGDRDVYTLTLSEDSRVVIHFGDNDGVSVDLSSGLVSDDGRGNTGQITVTGGTGTLELHGTSADDSFIGSARDDFFSPGDGNDTVDGGAGIDRVRYVSESSVLVDLALGTATGLDAGLGFTDRLIDIEGATGTRNGNDTLRGDAGDNWLEGRGGDDSIDGRDGADTFALTDVTRANTILSTVTGGFQAVSSQGADHAYGMEWLAFADGTVLLSDLLDIAGLTLNGTTAAEVLTGSSDGDTIDGGQGGDTIEAGFGNDDVTAGLGADSVSGGYGNDFLRGGLDDDTIDGGPGADVIRGQSDGDHLDGGDGDDNIKGGGGNDTLNGAAGNDFLKGGTRRDHVAGGAGDDKLLGNAFDDTLRGGAGNDRLIAGGDNDLLDGGTGDDLLKGGSGDDVFVFDLGHGSDRITDFGDGADRLEISLALADGQSATQIAAGATLTADGVEISLAAGDVILLSGLGDTTGLAALIDVV